MSMIRRSFVGRNRCESKLRGKIANRKHHVGTWCIIILNLWLMKFEIRKHVYFLKQLPDRHRDCRAKWLSVYYSSNFSTHFLFVYCLYRMKWNWKQIIIFRTETNDRNDDSIRSLHSHNYKFWISFFILKIQKFAFFFRYLRDITTDNCKQWSCLSIQYLLLLTERQKKKKFVSFCFFTLIANDANDRASSPI